MENKPDLSCFSGYFGKSLAQRREILNRFNAHRGTFDSQDTALEHLTAVLDGALSPDIANKMIENQIGVLQLPLGICPYMYVNNRHYVVPMVTEEPSVIAAVSSISKLAFEKGVSFDTWTEAVNVNGGFVATASDNVMTAQVQILLHPQDHDLDEHLTYSFVLEQATIARDALRGEISVLMAAANEHCPGMVKRGGGVRHIRIDIVEPKRYELSVKHALATYLEEMNVDAELDLVRSSPTPAAPWDPSDLPYLVAYFSVDVCDSMGANLLNGIAEGVAPLACTITGTAVPRCRVSAGLRILSNLCLERWVRCGLRVPVHALAWKDASGEQVCAQLLSAWRLARDDPMRACTHNKGAMNGITAVALASGQDTRAIEASIHAYAGCAGRYQPLTSYAVRDGHLECVLEAPLAVGTRGGSVGVHPSFKWALTQLGWPSARELAMLLGCVGLAQNFAAMRALAIEGIQKGHMTLHNRKG